MTRRPKPFPLGYDEPDIIVLLDNEKLSRYMKHIGSKGGRSKSPAKLAALARARKIKLQKKQDRLRSKFQP